MPSRPSSQAAQAARTEIEDIDNGGDSDAGKDIDRNPCCWVSSLSLCTGAGKDVDNDGNNGAGKDVVDVFEKHGIRIHT